MKARLLKRVAVLVVSFVLPLIVLAQTTTPSQSGFDHAQNNLNTFQNAALLNQTPQTPQIIIARIIQIALGLIGIVFVLLMVYAGYLWMTARGNEDQVERSRNLIIQAISGAVIVFLAYFITAFVVQRIGESVFRPVFY
ncbi:hypothetical protein COV04_02115 [Candidatus Uhrbacteria bacterium CG10_big_fil_rev_8_21_14_0_10_48_11]|uniref:DUF5671 domain-containing protein n=1 Tax=Candidatus Uhrbacteria bacterium CG10_big_fil_rev_8_21_14_0_10_48_11 TaxID=1975037 RepID=A0A2M8LES2_9BACT|nr:MAG: hypothetical protein COV04_02115 [Candidatus Uhrbacteria bacterium CG10_big_fil_rev_8_21_14_0_10_48_11]